MVKASTDPKADSQSDSVKKPARKAATKAPKAAAAKSASPKAEKAAKPAVATPKAPVTKAPVTKAANPKKAAKADTATRKKDFVERILEAAGPVNKAQAKAVVDHVLAELAAAIQKGESLILPPLGKLRVAAHADKNGVPHTTLKVKGVSKEREKTATPPLAETKE